MVDSAYFPSRCTRGRHRCTEAANEFINAKKSLSLKHCNVCSISGTHDSTSFSGDFVCDPLYMRLAKSMVPGRVPRLVGGYYECDRTRHICLTSLDETV
eukprot:g32403.t1